MTQQQGASQLGGRPGDARGRVRALPGQRARRCGSRRTLRCARRRLELYPPRGVRGAQPGTGTYLQRARAVRPRRHPGRDRGARARRGGTRARCAAPVLRGRNGTRGGTARRGDDGGGSRKRATASASARQRPARPDSRSGSSRARKRPAMRLSAWSRPSRGRGGLMADLGRRQPGTGAPRAGAARPSTRPSRSACSASAASSPAAAPRSRRNG